MNNKHDILNKILDIALDLKHIDKTTIKEVNMLGKEICDLIMDYVSNESKR